MPFKLWPMQIDVINPIVESREVVALKARQIGLSWLVLAIKLHKSLTSNGKLVLVFSQGKREANEMIRRVQVLYERLPDWFRCRCPDYAKPPNMETISWTNGSRFLSLPSTKKAGRSFTASDVIFDEASRLEYSEELMAAAQPTVDAGGQLILLSSANGPTGAFADTWFGAVAKRNGFKPIFLPWWARPDRDPTWRDRKLKAAKDETARSFIRQEFPATALEAFVASGKSRFEPEWIEAQAVNVRDGMLWRDLPPQVRDWEGLELYTQPRPGRDVLISADTAEGLDHGDFCDAVVFDTFNLEELGNINGRWEPDEFARRLKVLSDLFGAEVLVERNNHGHACLLALEKHGCERIALGHDGREGWLTNSKTKPIAIDALAQALADRSMVIRCEAALSEMRIYQRSDGRTGAPAGKNDDRVMSRANAMGWIAMVGHNCESSWGSSPWAGRRW